MGKSGFHPQIPQPAEVNPLIVLYNAERHTELENRARLLLRKYPEYGIAWHLLGMSLHAQGKGGLIELQKAVALLPGDAAALTNLGNAQNAAGLFADAAANYRSALTLNPGFALAHNNLGYTLNMLGQHLEAEASCRQALALNPNYAEAYHNLSIALEGLGNHADAEACCHRALQLKPDFAEACDNLLFNLNYTAQKSSASHLELAQQYGRMVSSKVARRYSDWVAAGEFERLRVGMVSGDLRNHPVGYFLEGLLAHIDPARIELIAYPANPIQDELTARIKPYFSAWKPLYGLNDAAAAHAIHADGIHVLLDLSGHTRYNRLPVFAWKPAPVQASWLGYFATTGVTEMDYLLADPVSVTDSQRDQFTETVWLLPDTRLCFTPPDAQGINLPVAPLPALSNGYITFGCFQRLEKLSEDVWATWADIFAALPDARLYWQCKQLENPEIAKRLSRLLQQHGIDDRRVTLRGAMPRPEYLSTHTGIDMILDTFPFSGGTTTCEALWMGVPTLTLAGDTLLARQGASMMAAAGLEEWIASSKAEYISKAITLSSNLPKLAALRLVLREQVRRSPLFDTRLFAHQLENALWEMWRMWKLRAD